MPQAQLRFARLIMIMIIIMSIFPAAAASARIVVVSDIDDTIKNTHVRSLAYAGLHVINPFDHVTGMSELYNFISDQLGPSVSFHYVTNALEFVAGDLHERFLAWNAFPGLNVHFRQLPFGEHKVPTIREILYRERPTTVVLVGDNGQHDIDVYDRIRREFGDEVRIHQYIRMVYSSRSEPDLLTRRAGQRVFVTPVEIALDLKRAGLLPASDTDLFVAEIAERIVQEIPLPGNLVSHAFPDWQDCSDLRNEDLPRAEQIRVVNDLVGLIRLRCQVP